MSTGYPSSFPITIQRSGWGCFLIVPLCIIIGFWCWFLYGLWEDSPVHDKLMNGCIIACALFGLFILIFGIRTQYDEKIEITATTVSYKRNGPLRKTVQWDESLLQYAGIRAFTDTGIGGGPNHNDDVDLFPVQLVHVSQKKKNVMLVKNAGSGNEQLKLQEHYMNFLKLQKV